MEETIKINQTTINAYNVQLDTTHDMKQVDFTFEVTHAMYHDITTLLYENDFTVELPERDMTFSAVITQYSTSITNLYKPDTIGEFHLELTEK